MAEVMARATATNAIMINPAIEPSKSLQRSIGPLENYVTGEKYIWTQENCDAFKELEWDESGIYAAGISRTVIVDLGDEILDARQTISRYEGKVALHVFEGGSHRFDHMKEALPKDIDLNDDRSCLLMRPCDIPVIECWRGSYERVYLN